MRGILYVGHGSRVEEGNRELRTFIEKAKQQFSEVPIQEIGFIELTSPTIVEAITNCVEQGATEIAVVPVLLLTAQHAKEDIPEEVEKAKEMYPHVRFAYGRPFGIESAIIDLVKKRTEQAGLKKVNGRPNMEEREAATLVVVGRGSSDPDQTSDLFKITRLVWEYTPVTDIEVCFIAATHPTVDEGLMKAARLASDTIYVIPYILFTGVLMNGLQKQLTELNQQTDKTFILGDYLGFDDQLIHVLAKRTKEVLDKLE
ncbi:sirohydrochlorin chelatase [Alkalicoccobacillus murimartini]|uniref:Sirohydrochlorin cobaltochelatase n=1 Tax=Alkalicoccobacillus murimartini TaxID=171685 RepID=A0ABT9YDT1_9BACI|nr:sirohydrochlorin chelatase [Alkalicoccobacillus murimartini]MDQ0205650.1 sirohydrochlorin cobaltochelatase [Alkalicoccobacillus murimartini]